MARIFAIALFTTALGLACASSPEPEVAPAPAPEPVVVEAAPAPAPVAEPVPELPKTASLLPLVGLMGVAGVGLGTATRMARRRVTRGR
ncbi:MAG: hypothetical protein VX466_13400 [Myxococcota bacterium]|nr:hypothetical protein [Myxococcota bacterium]